eukprot:185154-Hanusia_phi.AAC.12
MQLDDTAICLLPRVSKVFTQILQSSDEIQRNIQARLDRIPGAASRQSRERPLIAQLAVYTLKGCMLCPNSRIRKIYHPFQRRLCKQCLYANTIERYYLVSYGIDEAILQDLPCTETNFYKNGNYYILHHFWKGDVHKITGKTVDQWREDFLERQRLEKERKEAEVRNRQLKRDERIQNRRRYCDEWHRILSMHFEETPPLSALRENAYMQDLYRRKIKHSENRLKMISIHEKIMQKEQERQEQEERTENRLKTMSIREQIMYKKLHGWQVKEEEVKRITVEESIKQENERN